MKHKPVYRPPWLVWLMAALFWSAVAFSLFGCTPSLPDETGRVPSSQGGLLRDHVKVIAAHDGPVILDGTYVSSATLWLGADNACVTADARFGFHPPSSYGRYLEPGTYARAIRVIAKHYPEPLGSWYLERFAGQGGEVVWITGRELIGLDVVRSC